MIYLRIFLGAREKGIGDGDNIGIYFVCNSNVDRYMCSKILQLI
jgi:hypothetical protein